jgi:hypothetical protein
MADKTMLTDRMMMCGYGVGGESGRRCNVDKLVQRNEVLVCDHPGRVCYHRFLELPLCLLALVWG